jgi:N-glycosylase/DNA lyase
VIEGSWRDLPVGSLEAPSSDLDLSATLDCGQAFRWRLAGDGWWHGVVGDRAVRLRRVGEVCEHQTYPGDADEGAALLRAYLRLDVDLPALVADFERRCPRIRPALRVHPGIRVLDQSPEETLLSFLCSPANSVLRISRSIDHLAREHGAPIARLDGVAYHSFPDVETLATLPDAAYRAAGLGWRGVGLRAAAERLREKPAGWLAALRSASYGEAKAALVGFPYVGPKIADCVCLFSLLKDEAVPVDTHVWQLARDLFADSAESGRLPKTLTAGTYSRVLALYQERYGPFAGWAQQYLYHWKRHGCLDERPGVPLA